MKRPGGRGKHRESEGAARGFAPAWRDGHAVHVRTRYVRCGRARCACRRGDAARHGPYRYAVWRGSDGKLHETYLGLDVSDEDAKRIAGRVDAIRKELGL